MLRVFIVFLVAGLIGALVAHNKGRNAVAWFLICFFVPLSLLILAVLPAQVAQGRTKQCPYCAEIIKEDSLICRFCKKELPVNMVQCKSCGIIVQESDICSNCGKPLRS